MRTRGAAAAQVVVNVTGNPTSFEPAASNGYAIERTYYKLDGTQVDPAQVRQNDRLVIVLKVTEAAAKTARVLLVDRLPAGFEIDNPKLVDSDAVAALPNGSRREVEPVHTEYRDDRFVAAFDRDTDQAAFFTVAYMVRAVAPGSYVHPPAVVEDMYRPERFGRTAFGTVEVTAGKAIAIRRWAVRYGRCTSGRARTPSPLVGEDRLGAKAPSEEGGRRGRTHDLDGGGRLRRCASLRIRPALHARRPPSPLGLRPSWLSPARGERVRRWRRRLLVRRRRGRSRPSGLVAAFALWSFVDALGPLDLSAAEKRSTVVLDRDGRLLRPFATADGRWRLPVAAADVDPRFLAMLKAYEDRRFDRHPGIDPMALLRAAGQLLAHGRVVSGGSTLTMQVARLLEPREERTLAAKARQLVRAVQLERRLSKPEILALYLTLAPYGGNLEGTRAATLAYFGREPKRLSFAEAALLVALPQSPETRRPDRFAADARRARDRVLDRASPRGLLNAAEARAAKAEDVPAARRPFPMLAAHATEAAVAERPDAKVHRLAIDGRLQASLETLVRERLEPMNAQLSAAILVIDNDFGEVRAHVGSAGYLSRDRAGAVDMTRGAALARIGAEAVHLRARLRERRRPSRDPRRRPAVALRRLCAGELRSLLPGHRHGAPGAAAVAQRAGGRASRRGRAGALHCPAAAGRSRRSRCRRRRRPGSRSGSAGSASRLPT